MTQEVDDEMEEMLQKVLRLQQKSEGNSPNKKALYPLESWQLMIIILQLLCITYKYTRRKPTYINMYYYFCFCLDAPNIGSYESYLHYICLNDLLDVPILDARLDLTTISQFLGVQKLPEHYHPSSLAFSEYEFLEFICQFCFPQIADTLYAVVPSL